MLILMMFLAAQGVLGFVIWAGVRLARREPDLVARLAGITEIAHRPTRLEAARKELVWTRGEIAIVVEQIERARRRLSEFIPLPEPSSSIVWFVALTGILYEGESGVALLLNLAARFANMSDAVAAFVSPIVAAALFAALHVILGALVQIGAMHRPQRILHRAKLGAVIGGAVVILAAWAVLSGRSFTDQQMIEMVASWGLLVLALLLSVAGAFASLVVTTLSDERAVEQRVARLEKRRSALERHLEAVQRDLEQHDNRPSNFPPLSAVGGGVALAGLLAMLLVTPTAAQGTARPPAPSTVSTKSSGAASSPVAVTPHTCETLLDVSMSIDVSARQQAVERMATELDTLVSVFNCAMFRFSAFSGDPPFNVLQETPTLPVVVPMKSCVAAKPDGNRTAMTGAVEWLYPNTGKAHQEDAARKCLVDDRQRYEGELRNRRTALDAATAVWLEVARTPARGSCTALDFATQRALSRSQHLLVLSDGSNTCADPRVDLGVRPGLGQTLTFLLLPSAGPNASARGLRNQARLATRYPASRVLFLSELTSSMWLTLKPAEE